LNSPYFDSAYLAKCYLEEPDSAKIREFVQTVEIVYSSALCLAEVSCSLHRAVRERIISKDHASYLRKAFSGHLSAGIVQLIPISESILRTVETVVVKLPSTIFLRAGDAVHLATAKHEGFSEIWSNDRHMLRAASNFGIAGRSV
jgi:predicted nucleic acid-binding protein